MKILFATDGASQSDAAIDMLKKFRLVAGDEIKIISVIDMAVPMAVDIYGGGYIPDTAEMEKDAKENAVKILDETTEKLRSNFSAEQLNITSDVLFGSPESRIVETADEMKPNLVVVGSHNYSTWERLFFGSVSDSVIHHVPCSVLVVRCPPE